MNKIRDLYLNYLAMPIAVKASVWFIFCNFLLKGIGFLTSPLFALFLPLDEYGKMNLFNTYQQIILIFATFELSLGAYQRGILKYNNHLMFTNSTITLSTLITLIVYCLCFPFRDQLCNIMRMDFFTYNLLFIYFLFQPAFSCWIIKKRMDFKYQSAVLLTIITSIIPIFVSLLFVYFNPIAESKNRGTLISLIICYLPFYLKYFKPQILFKNISEVLKHWKYELNFQLPLVPHSLSYLVLGQIDRIMIGSMLDDKSVALYSVSSVISMAVSIFQTSLNQAFLPYFYKKMQKNEYKDISKIVSILLVLIAYLIYLCILVAPDIVKLLYSKDYYESIWVIPPIMLGVFFMYLYTLFTNIETYFEKTKYIMYVSIACAIINITLNYLLIEKYGYIVCGYTTLFSYICFGIGHGYFYRKICEEKGIYIYNFNNILLISVFLTIITLLVILIYNDMLLRWILIIILLLIGLLNFKRIKKILTVLNIK